MLQSGGAIFVKTHWSVVAPCQAGSPAKKEVRVKK
jgi:hypothetical protein